MNMSHFFIFYPFLLDNDDDDYPFNLIIYTQFYHQVLKVVFIYINTHTEELKTVENSETPIFYGKTFKFRKSHSIFK